jgi:hypothetical protein
MIPKILHYVWVGGPLPDEQRDFIETWRRSNPDFRIICWDEQNIDMSHQVIRDAYQKKLWATVADIARLQAVLKMGGIYFDTDFRVYKSLEPMLHHNCFWAFQEDHITSDQVCNGAFGAEAGHWFIERALLGLYGMRINRFIPQRPTTFGPKHITNLLRQEGLGDYDPNGVMIKDMFIAPIPVFFPFGWKEQFTPACITENTLAAHFWAKSWETTIPWPIRTAKKIVGMLRSIPRSSRRFYRPSTP